MYEKSSYAIRKHTNKAKSFKIPGMRGEVWVGMAAVRPRLVEATGGFWALWGFQSDPLTLFLIAVE